MKMTELRIGNAIACTFMGSTEHHKVLALAEKDFVVVKKNISYHIDICHGIPLTAERMEKVGGTFDYQEQGYQRWEFNGFELWGNFEIGFALLNGNDQSHWEVRYKYIHEIQNLHLLLLGEDLIPK